MSAACDVVLVVVVDEAQVREVLWGPGGLMESARQSLSVVVLSTIGVPALLDMAEEASAFGCHPARLRGDGWRCCGHQWRGVHGRRGQRAPCGASGRSSMTSRPRVFHMGPLGAGMSTKLVRNLITYCTWHVMYEAGVLAERSGVDLAMLADVIE